LAFAIAICLWLLALNSNKTFFWSSDFVPGLPIPFASPAAASKAQVLFLFDQMIDLDFEFLFTKGRERGSGVLSSWMFQTTILDFQHLLQTESLGLKVCPHEAGKNFKMCLLRNLDS
jgi:hypothetical protein